MPWAPHGLLLQAVFAVNVENLHVSCAIAASDRFSTEAPIGRTPMSKGRGCFSGKFEFSP